MAFNMWATDVNCLFHVKLSIYLIRYTVKQSSTHPLLPQNHIQMRMVSIVYVTVCALLATIADGTASTKISTTTILADDQSLIVGQNCEGRAVYEFANSMPFLTEGKIESNFCFSLSFTDCYLLLYITDYFTTEASIKFTLLVPFINSYILQNLPLHRPENIKFPWSINVPTQSFPPA